MDEGPESVVKEVNANPKISACDSPAIARARKSTKFTTYTRKTKYYTYRANRFAKRTICPKFMRGVKWIDDHNGFVTALATAVIAYLTFSLAGDSARQAETSARQLKIIQGQLDEMRSGATDTKALAQAAKDQLQAMRDQMTIANPPKLVVRIVHVWNKNDGSLLNPNNPFPDFTPGNEISGAAFAGNLGSEVATIRGSDLIVVWSKAPLNMNNPDWGDPGHNKLMPFEEHPPYGTITNGSTALPPGKTWRWDFSTKVPTGDSPGDLYVIGHVIYLDRLGTVRGTYFARRYDGDGKRFVKVKDEDYETYQ